MPFRSIEEVKRFLKEKADELRLDQQLIDRSMSQLAKMVKAAQLTAADSQILDFTGGPKQKRKTMNVDFPVVSVPDVKTLKEHYDMAERLSEQYKFLSNTEAEVKMNFAGDRGSQLKDVLGQFAKLKAQLEETLKNLFMHLAQIAEGHAPKQYLKFVKSLADELEENKHIECDGLQTMTYAALDKENKLVFAGYIILLNAVSDDQKTVPHLYIVIKWTVDGNVELFVEHDFVAPSLLHGGIVVSSLRAAAQAIASQMALEGFSSQIGNLPVSMQIKEPTGGLRREAFSAADWIESVSADDDVLIFKLKTTDPQKVEEVQSQIYLELKALAKRKRSTQIKVRRDQNILKFTFSNIEHGEGIHPYDLEFLHDRYKLSDKQLRQIVNTINGE
jgi:hypothetical protein